MKETLCLLQNKLKSIVTRDDTTKPPPLNECSHTLVEPDPYRPGLVLGTKLPTAPWDGVEFVTDRPVYEEDLARLRYLISLLKDIHQGQNAQFDFFKKHSEFLQVDQDASPPQLCLIAPTNIIKEQQDLLTKERALNAEFKKKKNIKRMAPFWKRFRKSRPQSELDEEYANLKKQFIALAADDTTSLKVISFLTIVFSCRTGMVDDLLAKKAEKEAKQKAIDEAEEAAPTAKSNS